MKPFELKIDTEVADLKYAIDAQNALNSKGWTMYDAMLTFGSPMERFILQNGYHYLTPDPYGPERKRAYLKTDLDTETGVLTASANQSYSQTFEANEMDGGKVRYFEPMPDAIVTSTAFQNLVSGFLEKMLTVFDFKKRVIKIGIHAMRYDARENRPSFSSPIWLHKDDEPISLITVIDETDGIIGGDSVIAQSTRSIERVFHLKPFEGVLLTKNCLHAVTPMQAPIGCKRAHRDVLLITLEEHDDVMSIKDAVAVAP